MMSISLSKLLSRLSEIVCSNILIVVSQSVVLVATLLDPGNSVETQTSCGSEMDFQKTYTVSGQSYTVTTLT